MKANGNASGNQKRMSDADARRLVRDLTETWEPGAALRLSDWCGAQGLSGAASLLRAGTDEASGKLARARVLGTLGEALGLTRPYVLDAPPEPPITDAELLRDLQYNRPVAEDAQAILARKTLADAFVDLDFTPTGNARRNPQAEDRSCRPAQNKRGVIRMLVADDPLDERVTEVLASKRKMIESAFREERRADGVFSYDLASAYPESIKGIIRQESEHLGHDWTPAVPVGRTSVMLLGFPPTTIHSCETVRLHAIVSCPTRLLDLTFEKAVLPYLAVHALRAARVELIDGDAVPAAAFDTSYRDAEIKALREELEKRAVSTIRYEDGSRYAMCHLCNADARERPLKHGDSCLLREHRAPALLANVPTLAAGCEVSICLENTSENDVRVLLGARCEVYIP